MGADGRRWQGREQMEREGGGREEKKKTEKERAPLSRKTEREVNTGDTRCASVFFFFFLSEWILSFCVACCLKERLSGSRAEPHVKISERASTVLSIPVRIYAAPHRAKTRQGYDGGLGLAGRWYCGTE